MNYNYLLGMKLWSLTHEKVESLRDLKAKKEAEYTQMEKITEKELWLADLANFEISYNQYVGIFYLD